MLNAFYIFYIIHTYFLKNKYIILLIYKDMFIKLCLKWSKISEVIKVRLTSECACERNKKLLKRIIQYLCIFLKFPAKIFVLHIWFYFTEPFRLIEIYDSHGRRNCGWWLVDYLQYRTKGRNTFALLCSWCIVLQLPDDVLINLHYSQIHF